jgi:hypothetical protein
MNRFYVEIPGHGYIRRNDAGCLDTTQDVHRALLMPEEEANEVARRQDERIGSTHPNRKCIIRTYVPKPSEEKYVACYGCGALRDGAWECANCGCC